MTPAPARDPLPDDAPHLLVIDDDQRIRELLQRYLREQGFRVTAAGDSQAARRKLASLDFDLIIADVMMPGENGIDLTRAMRQERKVPVIMLTALTEADLRIAGLEAGADDYLGKPFDPRELVLRVNNILRRSVSGPPAIEQIMFGPYTFSITRQELKRGAEQIPSPTGSSKS